MVADRRAFLEKMAGLGTLSLVPAVGALAAPTAETHELVVEPYLQNLSSREVTIMWITARNCFSWVEYGEGTYTSKRAFAYNNGLIEANNRVNKITLDNLKPGTPTSTGSFRPKLRGIKTPRCSSAKPLPGRCFLLLPPPKTRKKSRW